MSNKITEIQIFPIKPNKGLVGFASFVYDNSIYISSVGIYTRPQGGYRLTFPTRKVGIKSLNIIYPINRLVAEEIQASIINEFEKVMKSYDRYD